jgi:phospholipase D1/2
MQIAQTAFLPLTPYQTRVSKKNKITANGKVAWDRLDAYDESMAEDGKSSGKALRAPGTRKVGLLKGLVLLALLFAFPAVWSWTSLGHWFSLLRIIEWQEAVRSTPQAFYLVVGSYLLGSLVFFPVTLLNIATVFTFGPIRGNVYALAGWLASAALTYGIGRAAGCKIVQKLAPSWLEQLVQAAAKHGFMTALALRVFPVAPFTVVNIFIGAWGIRFRDFFAASIVGRIPGIILLALAGFQVESLMRQPGIKGVVLLGFTLILVSFVLTQLSRHLLSAGRGPIEGEIINNL